MAGNEERIEGDEEMKKEDWNKEFEYRKLLKDFCRFSQKHGYLDSDWYAEYPPLIDMFVEHIRKKSNENLRGLYKNKHTKDTPHDPR